MKLKSDHLTFLFSLLLVSVVQLAVAQKVTVSKEISIRTDYAYDLLGQLDDRIILYRDKGNERLVEVFDENMKFLYDRELQLEIKKSNVYGIAVQQSDFTVFSGYRKKNAFNLLAHKFNKDAQPLDTFIVLDQIEDLKPRSFEVITSKDKSKTVLLSSEKENILHLYVVENDSLQLLWWNKILIKDFDLRKDYHSCFVSDEGEVNVLLYDRNKEAKAKESQFMLIGASGRDDVFINRFFLDKKYIIDFESRFDDLNQRFVIAGLSSAEEEYDADSYFYLSKPLSTLEDINIIEYKNFDNTFIEEVYGQKLGKKKRLDDFVTRDVIVRNDGGIILVTEMEKEFYRRSSFNSGARGNGTYGNGWVDLYTEDIVIVSINNEGKEDWKKILYKKQFAQDDGGSFSSFFIFKTPSRMRFIYNDEIKNNITVSEYVMDPLGRFQRNSLLSTEYQKLKIRWKDGMQISSTSMIAPSENNFKLSLVKIDYGIKS